MSNTVRIGEKERAYVLEVLESQFRTSAGNKMTKRLEEVFANLLGVKYAISFINGTATMHAALAAAGVKSGDEVIVPPLTMASTSLAVLHAHATPVFADIDPRRWTINPLSIEALITPRTKAIIPVSIYGLSPDMDSIMDIAARHNLFVLGDDAQCLLGYYKRRIVGTIAHASSFSFQSSKQLASGEGGMIVTNDESIAHNVRRFNSLGYEAVGAGVGKGKISKKDIQDPNYERHTSIGWNYRIPELCAAVLLGQLEHIEELVSVRTRAAKYFSEVVKGCDWLIPQETPEDIVHPYWTYALKLENDGDFSWHAFRDKYVECGGDGFYGAWQLTYFEPAFRGMKFDNDQSQTFASGLCPVAERIQPKLMQFKTNYFDSDVAIKKAEALSKTIAYFGA